MQSKGSRPPSAWISATGTARRARQSEQPPKSTPSCAACTGLGTVYTTNLPRILDDEKSLTDGAVLLWDPRIVARYIATLRAAGRHYGFEFDPSVPVRTLSPAQRDLLLYGVDSPSFRSHYPKLEAPATVAKGRFEGVVTNLLRRHAEHAADADTDYKEKLERLLVLKNCLECGGTRLRPEARVVRVAGQDIVEVSRMPLAKELARRSTGRTLYLLDEPTTGLHPADTAHLVLLLQRLVNAGNTVIVIEHNLDVVKCADWMIDLGPEGGEAGGQVIAKGTPETVTACPESITGQMLKKLL